MVRTYGGLSLDFEEWGRIGAGLSWVNFPHGSIRSTQPAISYVLPLDASGRNGHPDGDGGEQRVALTGSQVSVGNSVTTDLGAPQSNFRLVCSYSASASLFAAQGGGALDEWVARLRRTWGPPDRLVGFSWPLVVLAGRV